MTAGRAPSLDALRFRAVDNEDGEVDTTTEFLYAEGEGVVCARYAGGAITLGFLVGTREGDELDFRYTHLNARGETATGHCRSRIEVLEDGRLRLHEEWEWESRDGGGTSVVEQVAE